MSRYDCWCKITFYFSIIEFFNPSRIDLDKRYFFGNIKLNYLNKDDKKRKICKKNIGCELLEVEHKSFGRENCSQYSLIEKTFILI